MTEIKLDLDLLMRFEATLDPRRPERGEVPAQVLGYGEISSVLAIGSEDARRIAYKRMPMFRSAEEADRYQALHRRYVRTLTERAGVRVAPCATTRIVQPESGRVIVYIAQQLLPEEAIAHNVIYRISAEEVTHLVLKILAETAKVFDFNRIHQGNIELGFDAQVSNWAVLGFDPERGGLPQGFRLAYLDTSTPLLRRRGIEQLNPELFLRSAPSFLLPLVRRAFLPDVMTRYYDFRRVALDLVANFEKEGRPELIPGLIDAVNWFFLAERLEMHFKPLTVEEMRRYYRWDALIWRVYLALRKLDRELCRLRRKDYPYMLPARVRR